MIYIYNIHIELSVDRYMMIVDIRPTNCMDGNDRAIYYIFSFRFGTVKVNILESGMALMNTMFLMVFKDPNTILTQTIQTIRTKHQAFKIKCWFFFTNSIIVYNIYIVYAKDCS